MFPVKSFYDRQHEHCAVAVFDLHGALCYCNRDYSEDFGEYDYARLSEIADSGGVEFINAQKYLAVRHRFTLHGRSYVGFSLGLYETAPSATGGLSRRDVFEVIGNYLHDTPSRHFCSASQVIRHWKEENRAKKTVFRADADLQDERSGVVCSPGALACALSLVYRMVSDIGGGGLLELSLRREKSRVYISVAAKEPVEELNAFLLELISTLGERTGFEIVCADSDNTIQIEMAFVAAAVSGMPLSAQDIAAIRLASAIIASL